MATITSRPPKYGSVGGFFPNPLEYELDSILDFEEIELKDSGGLVIATKKQRVISGSVSADFADLLSSQVTETDPSSWNMVTSTFFLDSKGVFEYYINTDNANPRFACLAKKNVLDADLDSFVIDATKTPANLANFTDFIGKNSDGSINRVKVKGVDLWLNIIIGDSDFSLIGVQLKVSFFDLNGSLISTQTKLFNNSDAKNYLRVLLTDSQIPSNTAYFEVCFNEDVNTITPIATYFIEPPSCNTNTTLAWFNRLGAFEIYTFDGEGSQNIGVIQATDFLPTKQRIKTDLQKVRQTRKIINGFNIPTIDRIAIEELFSSTKVFLVENGEYKKCRVITTNSSPISTQNNFHDIAFEIELEYENG